MKIWVWHIGLNDGLQKDGLYMRMYDIIEKKRDCGRLSDEEIAFFINGVTNGDIPDYQTSALLMAICLNGLDKNETFSLTRHMAESGKMVDLSALGGIACDKHSTGGVGDKTTLITAPVMAACGVKVAKMSGRGLGHTGGTIDKLESIPGFKTDYTESQFIELVRRNGLAVISASKGIDPADKKLYALRDVTATVNSVPLIASSVMSKKLAAGSGAIVLDVKVGSGAFMKDVQSAEQLAGLMVSIGKSAGRRMCAVLSSMDAPLGRNIGNSLEVEESLQVLRGGGSEDLKEVSLTLAAEGIALSLGMPPEKARKLAEDSLLSGSAERMFLNMVSAQNGDIKRLPKAQKSFDVVLGAEGYITRMDAEKIGIAAICLGAGRNDKEDKIDYSAGIVLNKKTGDFVKKGDVAAVFYSDSDTKFAEAEAMFKGAVIIGDKPQKAPLILKTIR